MNFTQCRQVMQYLWGTHPAAPRFSDDDKRVTAISFFRTLWRYSINDVLDAIDRTCKEKPEFMPSVYEIEKNIVKTISIEHYKTDEYKALDAKYERFKYFTWADYYSLAAQENLTDDKNIKETFHNERLAMAERFEINEILSRMEKKYYKQAEIDYNATQRVLAMQDLRDLGYDIKELGYE